MPIEQTIAVQCNECGICVDICPEDVIQALIPDSAC